MVDSGYFTEGGLMENMAQTAAARAGYLAKAENKPVSGGYIGAVKDFEVFFLWIKMETPTKKKINIETTVNSAVKKKQTIKELRFIKKKRKSVDYQFLKEIILNYS